MKDQERILKYLDGSLSGAELDEFKQTEDYHFVQNVTQSLQSFKAPEIDPEMALNQLKLKRNSTSSTIPLWSYAWKIAAVVILALALGVWFFGQPSGESLISSTSQLTELALPDASKVTLNKHSQIAYSENDWSSSRELTLIGEAYFEVEKGSKFTVNTNSGKVTVLGTRFTVKARGNFYEVTCYEGKVEVTTNGNDSKVVLSRGDQARYIANKYESRRTKDLQPAWSTGYSDFDDMPFHFVVKELERQFDVTVTYPKDDAERHFSGSFSHEDLESALKAITIPLSLEFQINGDSITLSK